MPSNIERKARRKRQTRLVFESATSSPAAGTLSPARMRYSLRGESGKKQTPTVVIDESEDELTSGGKGQLAVVITPKKKDGEGRITDGKYTLYFLRLSWK